jgi:hypothetical protein
MLLRCKQVEPYKPLRKGCESSIRVKPDARTDGRKIRTNRAMRRKTATLILINVMSTANESTFLAGGDMKRNRLMALAAGALALAALIAGCQATTTTNENSNAAVVTPTPDNQQI